MGLFTQLLLLAGACFIIWWLVRRVRANPEVFSKANLSKSMFTMGVLALILIAFIAVCIMILRASH